MDNVSINNTDNDMLRDKMRSYSVLNTLYHETRQEIDLLNRQISVKDGVIADLKARLGRHERLYMTVGDKESVLISPSNSLVESLLNEICKLKQKKNEGDLKAARQEIQRLNTQLREKELELETIRCQPDHEKDREIQRLRVALQEREQAEATRSVLCTSLAEEADQLRRQLGATVKVCQELMARLEKDKRGGGEVPESSEMGSVNAQIRQLQEENQQLKQRVAYVLIYTDDFKSERADRERAQGQIDALKEQVSQLKQQESRDVVPLCHVHIGHRISSKRSKDTSEPLLRTTAERRQQHQQHQQPAAAAATPNSAWNEHPGMSELQCPQCLATFSDTKAAEYLNHCLECARV
uniref:TNFAIP3 interacting protein 2 n=1 Tax=Neolamprologus brichardi TaxID=32507 RepID=A0A3Q4GZD9_NEOBR